MAERLSIVIDGKNNSHAAFASVRGDLQGVEGDSNKANSALSGIGKAAVLGVGAVAVGLGALGGVIGKVGFDFNSMQQQSEIAFTTILGDAEKAKSFMGELTGFAAKTPFELGPLTQYASRLAAVGLDTSRIIPLMTALGDATAGMGTGSQGIEQATRALTQMQQKGKVTGEEMLQLAEAGIPAWDALASKLGVDVATAQEMVSKGQVKVNDLFAALEERSGPAMERLAGMMEKQAGSFSGLISTAKDAFAQFAGAVMGPLFEKATAGLQSLTQAMATPAFMEFGRRLGAALGSAVESAIRFGAEVGPPLLAALGSLASFVTGTLAPAMASFIGEDILPKAQAFASFFTSTLLPAFQSLASAVGGTLGPALQQVFGVIAGNKEIIAGVAAAIGVGLVAAFTAWAIAAGAAAVATIAAAAPVIAIGVAIAALVTGVLLLINHWDQITAKFPILGAIADAVGAALGRLAGFFGDLASAIGDADLAGKAEAALDAIVSHVTRVVQEIGERWNQIEPVVRPIIDLLVDVVTNGLTIISNVVQAVMNVIQGDWSAAWENVKAVGSSAWAIIQSIVSNGTTAVAALVRLGWGVLKDITEAAWNLAVAAVQAGISRAETEVRGLPGKVKAAAGELGSTLLQAGKDLIQGFINGITSMGGALAGAVSSFISEHVPGPLKRVLGMDSPSKLFRQFGVWTAEGYAEGFGAGFRDLVEPVVTEATESVGSSWASFASGVATNALRVREAVDALRPWENALREAKIELGNLEPFTAEYAAHEANIQILAAEVRKRKEWIAVLKDGVTALTESRTALDGFRDAQNAQTEGGKFMSPIQGNLLKAVSGDDPAAGGSLFGSIQKLIDEAKKQGVPLATELGQAVLSAAADALGNPSPENLQAVLTGAGQLFAGLEQRQARAAELGTLTGDTFSSNLVNSLNSEQFRNQVGAAGVSLLDQLNVAMEVGGEKNIAKLTDLTAKMLSTVATLPEQFQALGPEMTAAVQAFIDEPTAAAHERMLESIRDINEAATLIPKNFESLSPMMQNAVLKLVEQVDNGAMPLDQAVQRLKKITDLIPKNFADLSPSIQAQIGTIIQAFVDMGMSAEDAERKVKALLSTTETGSRSAASAVSALSAAQEAKLTEHITGLGVPKQFIAPASGGGGGQNAKAEMFAAAVASPGGWTPELAAAFADGMNQIAEGMKAETDAWQAIERGQEQIRQLMLQAGAIGGVAGQNRAAEIAGDLADGLIGIDEAIRRLIALIAELTKERRTGGVRTLTAGNEAAADTIGGQNAAVLVELQAIHAGQDKTIQAQQATLLAQQATIETIAAMPFYNIGDAAQQGLTNYLKGRVG